jgi:hypothetical protein
MTCCRSTAARQGHGIQLVQKEDNETASQRSHHPHGHAGMSFSVAHNPSHQGMGPQQEQKHMVSPFSYYQQQHDARDTHKQPAPWSHLAPDLSERLSLSLVESIQDDKALCAC